ncbi:TerB family tellurite resistance protein [Kordiimonas marina]|uniref:TerB family tellurite resistance protein n=1 Tax=Kordiimonas marina TaxID=2872312 RepID=UPI001FF63BAD|nr:TerB family tellurite resistance protein [Kordiimonas marina]MCJ9429494.1 TerB family tellurite resistance protein [Kordiimonas marina]
MSIWGKIIGGTAGLALGGPLGALIGLTVGAAVDAGVRAVDRDPEATRRITFTIGVIALAAKMAKADGRVTREEVDAFKAVFRVPAGEMRNVGRVFDMARQHTAGYEAYARQIADLMRDNRPALNDLLEALFFIAEADGHVHPNELDYIRTVARIFGFNQQEIEALVHRHIGADPNCPYSVLGVDPAIGDEDLKRHYRKLVRETHPDRMIAAGVPSDFIAVATRRAAEINAAYDRIIEIRMSSKGRTNADT